MKKVLLATILSFLCLFQAYGKEVKGTITLSGGNKPAGVLAAAMYGDNWEEVTYVVAEQDGSYSLTLPDEIEATIMFIVPIAQEKLDGYNTHQHTLGIRSINLTNAVTTQNFTLDPCYEYIFTGYIDGKKFIKDDLYGTQFAVDAEKETALMMSNSVDKGDGVEPLPAFCIPIGKPAYFFFLLTLPSAGRIVTRIDNSGEPFMPDKQGAEFMNLDLLAAKTHRARLEKRLATLKAAGYAPSGDYDNVLIEAQSEIENAEALEGAEGAEIADETAGKCIVALEELEHEYAEAQIEKNRKGDLTIKIVDSKDKPIPSATITYSQQNRDFLFGVFDSVSEAGRETYEELQSMGINYVTAGIYWGDVEPQDGNIEWNKLDNDIGINVWHEMGLTIKAHPLIWLLDLNLPDYMKTETNYDAFRDRALQRVNEIVSHYQDRIKKWDLINEASGYPASHGFSREQVTELTALAAQEVKKCSPDSKIVINSAFDWYGISKLSEYFDGRNGEFSLSIHDYLNGLDAAGIKYDIIGQQMYDGGGITIFKEWGVGDISGVPTFDMGELSSMLDSLSTRGKPIHITEISVGSKWDPEWIKYGAGYWREPWNEVTQAEFIDNFYTLMFSKEKIEAITWWDVTEPAFISGGAWFDENKSPRQSVGTLTGLFSSWFSNGDVQTDSAGGAKVRGFAGDYKIAVSYGSETAEETHHVYERENGQITIKLENVTLPEGGGEGEGEESGTDAGRGDDVDASKSGSGDTKTGETTKDDSGGCSCRLR